MTRQGVHVDRIASAWLIRRFIDPQASFKFVAPKGYVPQPGEVRFDMFEAEFTHQGDRCTFEVLLERSAGRSRSQRCRGSPRSSTTSISRTASSAMPETDGIRTMIAALCAACDDDAERLRRGAVLLDDLYGYFQRQVR